MAKVTSITATNGTTYDIGAKYDVDGNEIKTSYIKSSTKGVASGVAELDSNGMVPNSQLPSDVINNVTLASSEWSLDATTGYYKQTKTVNGMTANSHPVARIKYPSGTTELTKSVIDEAANLLVEMETATDSVSFYAVSTPASSLTIYLKGV